MKAALIGYRHGMLRARLANVCAIMVLAALSSACGQPPESLANTNQRDQTLIASAPVELDPGRKLSPADVRELAIARAGAEYALSWCDESDRVFARYTADGVTLDSIPIHLFDGCSPSLLASGDAGYLATQVHSSDSSTEPSSILIRNVAPDGGIGETHVVADDVQYDSVPRLVSAGDQMLLGYRTVNDEFVVKRLSSSGVPLTAPQVIAHGQLGRLAYDGSEYLIAWRNLDNLVAAKYPADTSSPALVAVNLANLAYSPWEPELDFVAGKLVVVRSEGFAPSIDVFSSQLDKIASIPLDPMSLNQGLPGRPIPWTFRLAGAGNRALLMWNTGTLEEDNYEIIDERLSAAVLDVDVAQLVVPEFDVAREYYAGTAVVMGVNDRFAVAWRGPSARLNNVLGTTWHGKVDVVGTVDQVQPVALRLPEQWGLGAAFDGTRHLVLWSEGQGANARLTARHVSTAGQLVGEVNDLGDVPRSGASLAFNGANYLLVRGDSDAGMRGELLDLSGEPTSTSRPSYGNYGCRAAIGSDSTFLVAAQDPDTFELHLIPVAADGHALSEHVSLTATAGSLVDFAMAWGEQHFFIVWEQLGALLGQRLAADGQPIDTAPIVLLPASGVAPSHVQMAFGAGVFAVLYNEDSLIRVDPNGKVLDTEPISVPNAATRYWGSDLSFDGRAFVIASPQETSIGVVRFSPGGQVFEQTSFPAEANSYPFLSSAGDGTTQLFYREAIESRLRLSTRRLLGEREVPPDTSGGTGGTGGASHGTGGASHGTGGNNTETGGANSPPVTAGGGCSVMAQGAENQGWLWICGLLLCGGLRRRR